MNKIRYQKFVQQQRQKNSDSLCENCGKEHDHSYGTGRFCSKRCRAQFIAKHVKNHVIPHKKHQLNKKWKCSKCKSVFDTRAQLQSHKKEYHPYLQPWNKGLTKETSTIIFKISLKQSLNKKGKPGKPHTKETRNKISLTRSKQIDTNHSGFSHVKWYKVKNLNGIEYTVRGHWEENVAIHLNELGILWIKNTWISYYDDNNIMHRYNPDFYIPKENIYVEVKGFYSEYDQYKMKCVLMQNKNIKIYFIGIKQYKQFINGKINFDDSLKMTL